MPSTALARHLSNCYPSFKSPSGPHTGRKEQHRSSSLQGGTRDHRTLFKYLILEPLKDLQDLHIVGPILVVIDALDDDDETREWGHNWQIRVTRTRHASTTPARHLFDCYPSFKIALGQVTKNNTECHRSSSLQRGTRES
jgi:hypothetical protein